LPEGTPFKNVTSRENNNDFWVILRKILYQNMKVMYNNKYRYLSKGVHYGE